MSAARTPRVAVIAEKAEPRMIDLVVLLVAAGFFAACLAYLVACDRLGNGPV